MSVLAMMSMLGCREPGGASRPDGGSSPSGLTSGLTTLEAGGPTRDPTDPSGSFCAPETGPLSLAITREIPTDIYAYQLAAGRTLDENGDGVVDASDPQQLFVKRYYDGLLIDSADQVTRLPLDPEPYGFYPVLADLDSAPGAEYVVAWHVVSCLEPNGLTIFGDGRLSSEHVLDRGEGEGTPWITDLEGDGRIELLTVSQVRDAETGAVVAVYDLNNARTAMDPVAADLDLDGIAEIVAFDDGVGTRILDASGRRLAVCSPEDDRGFGNLAIGNLDEDPEGEVVVVTVGHVAVCDADGGLVARVELPEMSPDTIALGELDGDLPAEIVLGTTTGLHVLDGDLSVLFQRTTDEWSLWPATLADLDGDGYHEILVRENFEVSVQERWSTLRVLAGDGTERGSIDVTREVSAHSRPVVADLDADGLAEIALAGAESIQVLEDGVNGGWSIPDAANPWSGAARFPGDRGPLGEVPAAAPAWWVDPARNVWSGLATVGHSAADCATP